MACPHKWITIGYTSSGGQGSSPAERPTFYHCSTQPWWRLVDVDWNIELWAFTIICLLHIIGHSVERLPPPCHMSLPASSTCANPNSKTDVTPATKSRDFDARQRRHKDRASKSQVWQGVTGRVARFVTARRTVAWLVFGIGPVSYIRISLCYFYFRCLTSFVVYKYIID